MSKRPVIHWFRRDLRLSDNRGLNAALETGASVLPVFIFDPAILNSPNLGAPRMKFLVEALRALERTLRERDGQLVIRQGNPARMLKHLVAETGASAIYYNVDYTPYARRRDEVVCQALSVEVCDFDDALLLPPGSVMKADGDPYTVYTPFMKQWKMQTKPEIEAEVCGRFFVTPAEGGLDEVDWLNDFACAVDVPEASEAEAGSRLETFTAGPIYHYADTRNILTPDPFAEDKIDTSCLSPYLRFGLLSPRQAYWSARRAYESATASAARRSVETWINELVWREFYAHIIYHFPHAVRGNFRPRYDSLAWRNEPEDLRAWKDGQTGYPVVDAAMRQLKAIGWLPNRARMIVASFLTKDLLIDWREGERYFMNRLIDGDPAANNGGWQWTAGTGTDAQPYFRIFNPVSQSKKFDPNGSYIRRWIPELCHVPDEYIHEPWKMDPPPDNYPSPIVDHQQARRRTMAAYKAVTDDSGVN